jgi:hypothetical protein
MKQFSQTCCKSGINYNDIDNEIARLEMKRQSLETECNVFCNKLQGCLDNTGSVSLPKPRRSWSEDPFFDMILAEQHRKKKEMGIEEWEKYKEERMKEDAWY